MLVAERAGGPVAALIAALAAGPALHRMAVRLDVVARDARRAVEGVLNRFEPDFIIEHWAEISGDVAAAYLDGQLGALEAALEYLEAAAGAVVVIDSTPFLGQVGTLSLDGHLDRLEQAVADKVDRGLTPADAVAEMAEQAAEQAEDQVSVVGRDAVATTANNDPQFDRYARQANVDACDWCKMLAGRGAVYTEDTATVTREGMPYHTKQKRLRKDGSIYEPGGRCRCVPVALKPGDPLPDPVGSKVTTRQIAAARSAYREGARTAERAGSIDRQLAILRQQVNAGRATAWTGERIGELEQERLQLAVAMPRSAAALFRDLAYRYDPNQPRDPKGTPTGGQWTATDDEPTAPKTYKMKIGGKWVTVHTQAPAVYPDAGPPPKKATPDLELAAKQAKAKVAEDAAWAQVKLNNSDAAALKAQVARDIGQRMAHIPAADMAAAVRALDETDSLDFNIAMEELEAAAGTVDAPYVHLARDLDGNFYAAYKGESPIEGWQYARPGTPEYDAMVREGAVAGLVDMWAQSSNDHHEGSLAVQMAVRHELGVTDAAGWSAASGEAAYRDHAPVLRAYVRAQYDATQADLAARGITEVTVYRGTGIPLGDEPNYLTGKDRNVLLRPASSWSTDLATAHQFGLSALDNGGAGAMLTATVPASRVLSSPRTGMGCLSEAELVLLGGALTVEVQRL